MGASEEEFVELSDELLIELSVLSSELLIELSVLSSELLIELSVLSSELLIELSELLILLSLPDEPPNKSHAPSVATPVPINANVNNAHKSFLIFVIIPPSQRKKRRGCLFLKQLYYFLKVLSTLNNFFARVL